MYIDIISDEADLSLFWVLEVVQTHLNGLHYLLEQPRSQGTHTHIHQKYKSRFHWGSFTKIAGSVEFISAVFKLGSRLSISALAKFVQSRLVLCGDFISEVAEIANSFRTSFNKLHVWIHIGFTSMAPKGSLLIIVYEGNLRHFILILILTSFCQWLHSKTKWYHAHSLHRLILRGCNH